MAQNIINCKEKHYLSLHSAAGPRLTAGLYGCPICGQGLAPSELEAHLALEMDTLALLRPAPAPAPAQLARFGLDQEPRNRWEVSSQYPAPPRPAPI